MDKIVKDQLTEAGINVEEAVNRFMGNEVLLERFLKKFLEDPYYGKLTEAISKGEREDAFIAAHTLKGVCGNLAFTQLFPLFVQQVNFMRKDKWEDAIAMMPEITREYDKTVGVIQ